MGADFCTASLAWDVDTKLNWKAGFKAIDALKEKILDDIGYTKDDLVSALTTLRDSLKITKQNCYCTSREGTVYQIGNLFVLITGGMSWGDCPTKLYEEINKFNEIFHVLKEVGFEDGDYAGTNWKAIIRKIFMFRPSLQGALLGLDPNLDRLIEKGMRS